MALWVESVWNWRLEYKLLYWAICLSARSFACTAHSFTTLCALLALVARSTALIRSLVFSLAPELMGKSSMSSNRICRYHVISIQCAWSPQSPRKLLHHVKIAKDRIWMTTKRKLAFPMTSSEEAGKRNWDYWWHVIIRVRTLYAMQVNTHY